MAYLFTLLMLSFEGHEVFKFDEVQLTNVVFVACAFDVMSNKRLSNQKSGRFAPMFEKFYTFSFYILS